MIVFPDENRQASLKETLGLIDRWHIATSGDGCLWLQPRQDVLELREFCTLLKRIHRTFSDKQFNSLILCFDGVEMPRSLWLIMLRLLTAFAKIMQANCRIFQSLNESGHEDVSMERLESVPGVRVSPHRATPMVKLNQITIVIEPRGGESRESGVRRSIS